MSEYENQPEIPQEVGVDKLNNARANLRTATDVVSPDGLVQQRKEFGRCGACVFFERPNNCKVVEGPVAEDQVCDWIQVREGPLHEDVKSRLPSRSGAFAEPRALAWGLMKLQQLLNARVIDYQMSYAAPLLLLEDGQDPPHRFSVSLDQLVDTLGLDRGWTPQEVDVVIRLGKSLDFKPPVSYEEASELYGRGELSREEFEPFRRARAAEQRAKKL